MLWLGAICCWFVVTVLRGRRNAFAIGVVVSGLATVAALNVVNPDGLVARTNVDRASLDAGYVTSLSADAVPTLVGRLDRIDPSARRVVARALLRQWTRGHGWRTWSVARAQAEQAVRSHRAELEVAARSG
jgi:hypothetical protein